MKKQMREYPEVFKEQAVSLLRSSGRSAADIERELGITPGLLSRWNRLKAKAAGEVIAPRSNRFLAEEPLAEQVKQLERENARLRQEKEILKKQWHRFGSAQHRLHAPKPVRYDFVERHRSEFEVSLMCDLLQISRSGYYDWRTRPISQREMANQHLLDKIKAAYEANRGCYGSPRIYHEIKDEIPCSVNRVARLMRQHGIRGKQSKRYKTTTQQNKNHPAAPNHLAQDFQRQPASGKVVRGYHLSTFGRRRLVVPGRGD
ncbi:MAG: IS3 family transposase [Chloroflexi bacterium]|nr:IS3 family transposase [Chloroflexota bacterium]